MMLVDVAGRQDAGPTVSEVLDWQAFSATHFPGRRRHDLEALTAYGEYRRSHVVAERSPDGVRPPASNGPAGSTALQDWEDEGGAGSG
jgi:hypothetical protein